MDSFKMYYKDLRKLSFSGNAIGMPGCTHLVSILPQMKFLKDLRLSDCKITDKGAAILLRGLLDLPKLSILDLSGNLLGQSAFTKDMTDAFEHFFIENNEITEVYLDDNNLRGGCGEAVLLSLMNCTRLKIVSLSKNFLGHRIHINKVEVDPKKMKKGEVIKPNNVQLTALERKNLPAPIDWLSELLITSSQL